MRFGQERFSENNALLNRLIGEKKSLIAVHRGSWGGNIIQNTIGAYKCAILMGADMVESDVNSTTDGVLYSFHDGCEKYVFGGSKCIKTMSSEEIDGCRPLNTCSQLSSAKINRLAEVLEYLPEGKLLNIDRAWDIFPQVLELLDRFPKARQQVVIKAPLKGQEKFGAFDVMNNHPVKYMFMPIAYSMADVEKALSYPEINVVGVEVIAFSPEQELFQDENLAAIHDKGLYTWVNAINLGDVNTPPLYAGLDDDISVLKDPGLGWGKLFEKKIDIIQTDWPAILYAYRKRVLGVE